MASRAIASQSGGRTRACYDVNPSRDGWGWYRVRGRAMSAREARVVSAMKIGGWSLLSRADIVVRVVKSGRKDDDERGGGRVQR